MKTIITAAFLMSLMFLLAWKANGWPLYPSFSWSDDGSDQWQERMNAAYRASPASEAFLKQLKTPKSILAVLLLVGGDVIQKAVAQLTRGPHSSFTPAVFSFGWVIYAFSTVATAIGEGTFLPQPDYSSLVITSESGDRRENRSWVIGRLLRDLELKLERELPQAKKRSGLLVTAYKASSGKSHRYGMWNPRRDWLWWTAFLAFLPQWGLAAVPWKQSGNWSIFFITAVGTILAMSTASFLSMRTEKFQGRKHARLTFAITRGNGHKHVFIILPNTLTETDDENGRKFNSILPRLDEMASGTLRAHLETRILAGVFAILWVFLLVLVGGLEKDVWYLFGVGFLGMLLNSILAGSPRSSEAHGIPLTALDMNQGHGLGRGVGGCSPAVMDVLLEVEEHFPGVGHSLRPVFFPGRLRAEHMMAWKHPAVSEKSIKERLRIREEVLYRPEEQRNQGSS